MARSRQNELRRLLKNPPAESVGAVAPKLRTRPTFDFMMDEGEQIGMMFYFESEDGETSEPVVFLFGQEDGEKDEQVELAAAA